MTCTWDSCFSWVAKRTLRMSTYNRSHDFGMCCPDWGHRVPFLCVGWSSSRLWDFWRPSTGHARTSRETSSRTFDSQRTPWSRRQISWVWQPEWALWSSSHRIRCAWARQSDDRRFPSIMPPIQLFRVHLSRDLNYSQEIETYLEWGPSEAGFLNDWIYPLNNQKWKAYSYSWRYWREWLSNGFGSASSLCASLSLRPQFPHWAQRSEPAQS